MDDQSDSRSSTEVASLMGDEKQWHDVELNNPIRQTRRSRLLAIFKSSRWIVDTALLLVILALLVRDQWRTPAVLRDPNIWQFGQDFTGVGPKCRKRISARIEASKANIRQSHLRSPHSHETSHMRQTIPLNSSPKRSWTSGTSLCPWEWVSSGSMIRKSTMIYRPR